VVACRVALSVDLPQQPLSPRLWALDVLQVLSWLAVLLLALSLFAVGTVTTGRGTAWYLETNAGLAAVRGERVVWQRQMAVVGALPGETVRWEKGRAWVLSPGAEEWTLLTNTGDGKPETSFTEIRIEAARQVLAAQPENLTARATVQQALTGTFVPPGMRFVLGEWGGALVSTGDLRILLIEVLHGR